MSEKYYLITVYGDVDPVLSDPCDSPDDALALARKHLIEDGERDDGLFILSINADGVPRIEPFAGSDFE